VQVAKCATDNETGAVDTFSLVQKERGQRAESHGCDLNEEQQRAQPDTEREK
jgi:hypothetical protein